MTCMTCMTCTHMHHDHAYVHDRDDVDAYGRIRMRACAAAVHVRTIAIYLDILYISHGARAPVRMLPARSRSS
jgi:hypothetical protein